MIVRIYFLWFCFTVINVFHVWSEEKLDFHIHQQNLRLCHEILEEILKTFPKTWTPEQCAYSISSQLSNLGQELLKRGLNLNNYKYQKYEGTPYFMYSLVPMWEGNTLEPAIPLSLFIYVWPPEQFAKQTAKKQKSFSKNVAEGFYASNIHGHPIPCSVTVLTGTLCQENYYPVRFFPFNVAKKKDEEILHSGNTSFDDHTTPFVHRLVCRDPGENPAYSLHAYGAVSAKAVHDLFMNTFEQYSYQHILKEDGSLSYQKW